MRISDWSSDVCSSDLLAGVDGVQPLHACRSKRAIEPLDQIARLGHVATGYVGDSPPHSPGPPHHEPFVDRAMRVIGIGVVRLEDVRGCSRPNRLHQLSVTEGHRQLVPLPSQGTYLLDAAGTAVPGKPGGDHR